jgi:hypothetical protein
MCIIEGAVKYFGKVNPLEVKTMAKAANSSKTGAAKKPGTSKKAAGASHKESPAASTKKTASEPEAKAVSKGAAAAAATAGPIPEPRLPATSGKIGVFGGPKDRSFKPDDKLGLPTGQHFVYERAHSLNPKSFYCSMRFEYRIEHMSPEEAKRWWANKKLLVTHAKNGSSVVVRAVDHGPHENTGLAISVSPAALQALGAEVGDEVEIAFADIKLVAGPVEQQ